MILDRFQSSGNGSGSGFAFRQRFELQSVDSRPRTNRAEHELPVADLSLCVHVQPHRHGFFDLSLLEANHFVQVRSEQRLPEFSETKSFPTLPKPEIETVTKANPFCH